MPNEAEEITQAKMDELMKNPYQLLEERVLELEQRLDVVIDILGGMRRSFGNVTFVTPDDEVE